MALRQRGDTLVEVLVALAVTSLVLGATMATANRSLSTSLASQERGEAVKIAESQIERLRATGFTAVGGSTSFCFAGATLTAGTCSISGAGIAYNVNITRTGPTDHLFVVDLTWPRAGSGEIQRLTLRYVIY